MWNGCFARRNVLKPDSLQTDDLRIRLGLYSGMRKDTCILYVAPVIIYKICCGNNNTKPASFVEDLINAGLEMYERYDGGTIYQHELYINTQTFIVGVMKPHRSGKSYLHVLASSPVTQKWHGHHPVGEDVLDFGITQCTRLGRHDDGSARVKELIYPRYRGRI